MFEIFPRKPSQTTFYENVCVGCLDRHQCGNCGNLADFLKNEKNL